MGEWFQDVWRLVWTSTLNWDLVLRFLEIMIWPLVVLTGLIMVRPGRLIDAMLENGGEIAAAGAAIKLGKRINEVAETVRTDAETATDTAPQSNPLEESADPYTTILNGWGLVIKGLEDAVERTGIERLDRRDPMTTVRTLRRDEWIGNRITESIQELWDLRNQVVRAGSNKLKKRGINERTADQYYASASRIQTSIGRAISYRQKKAANSTSPVTVEPGVLMPQALEQRPN